MEGGLKVNGGRFESEYFAQCGLKFFAHVNHLVKIFHTLRELQLRSMLRNSLK